MGFDTPHHAEPTRTSPERHDGRPPSTDSGRRRFLLGLAATGAVVGGIGRFSGTASAAPDFEAGPFEPEQPVGTPPKDSPIGGGAAYKHTIRPDDDDDVVAVVADRSSLVSALESATSGDVVYVDDDAVIDVAPAAPVDIPGGVTLASGRGVDGSDGALLYTDEHKFHDEDFKEEMVFRMPDDDAILTGVRLRGPEQGHFQFEGAASSYEYKSVTTGVQLLGESNGVHNCEVYGFPHIAVYCLGSYSHVHHNYIHSNAQASRGYGVYSTVVEDYAQIEYNYFDWNRHDIASKGYSDERYGQPAGEYPSYVARFNVSGPNYLAAYFDVHGENESSSNGSCEEPKTPAGESTWIYHNTFEGDMYSDENRIAGAGPNNPGTAFVLRGVPRNHAWFQNNWIHQTSHGLPSQRPQNCDPGDTYDDPIDLTVENTARGTSTPSTLTRGAPVDRDCLGIRTWGVDEVSYEFVVEGDAERITDVERPHTSNDSTSSVSRNGDTVTVSGTASDSHPEWIIDGTIRSYTDDSGGDTSLILNGQRVSEAELVTDSETFDAEEPGTEPLAWRSPTDSSFEVVSASGRPGGTEVELRSGAAEPHILEWTDAGRFADGEITAIYDPSTATGNDHRVFLRCQNGGDDAYMFEPRPEDGKALIRRYSDGGMLTLEETDIDPDETDPELHVRFRVDGDGLRGKVWNAGDAEPDDWTIETTSTAVTGVGYSAIGTFNGPGERWSAVGVSRGSVDAPVPDN